MENDSIKISEATAFEPGKKYLIKITPKDSLSKEEVFKLLVSIKEMFDSKGIDAMVYPSNVCEIEAVEIGVKDKRIGGFGSTDEK